MKYKIGKYIIDASSKEKANWAYNKVRDSIVKEFGDVKVRDDGGIGWRTEGNDDSIANAEKMVKDLQSAIAYAKSMKTKDSKQKDDSREEQVRKAQEWIDYDLKRYGEVSETTKRDIEKLGLKFDKWNNQVYDSRKVKDAISDWEFEEIMSVVYDEEPTKWGVELPSFEETQEVIDKLWSKNHPDDDEWQDIYWSDAEKQQIFKKAQDEAKHFTNYDVFNSHAAYGDASLAEIKNNIKKLLKVDNTGIDERKRI